jgi:hypothetical protein
MRILVSLVTGSKGLVHWTWQEWSEIAGSPQGSPQQPTPSVVKPEGRPAASVNRDRKAVWDQVGLSHCRYEGLVTVRDEALLRRGHNDDQSRRGHQCSKTLLTGESRFHLSTPREIWTQVPCDGKQRVSPLDQWDMVRLEWDCRLSTTDSYWYMCTFTYISMSSLFKSIRWLCVKPTLQSSERSLRVTVVLTVKREKPLIRATVRHIFISCRLTKTECS